MSQNRKANDLSPVPEAGARALSSLSKDRKYRLGRTFSLGSNRQYVYVYRRGKSYPARHMVLIYLKARTLKVGFSVSSKVGGAVVRNRVRRRMMEDFRMVRERLVPGKYVFVARSASATADHKAMGKEMKYLLKKAGLFADQKGGS